MRTTRTFSTLLLLAAAIALVGCAVNPATGRREFSLVSASQEQAIGREGHQAIVAEYGIYDHPGWQARVDSIGRALAAVSELPNIEWHFTLLDDPVVNAFALPGGYIYITRGILAHLNSDAQLAGVLGHEIGHVTARHSAKRLSYQQLAGLGLGVASIVSEGFRRYGQLAETGLQLMFLKYGREDENQADELGVRYATAASFDPRQIPATYTMLKRTGEKGGSSLPSFLSTHPDPGDREVRTRTLAVEAAAGKSDLVINGREFLQSLDGVSFGRNPRNGYFEGAAFYHPDMRFRMVFPEGWTYQNGNAAVMAGGPNQSAMMQLTLAGTGDFTPSQYVTELQRRGSISGARGGVETLGGYSAWVGTLRVPNQDGSETQLAAGFIQQSAERTFQVLGRSTRPGDADEARILASIRTFGPLTEQGRLAATPDRLKVFAAAEAGSFESIVSAQGQQALDLEGTAILNNSYPDEQVFRRELIKIVTPGRLK